MIKKENCNRMPVKITRRKFVRTLLNSLFLLLFLNKTNVNAKSGKIVVAQEKPDIFFVTNSQTPVYFPQDIPAGSRVCGAQAGLSYLQQNFAMQPHITFRPIPLPEIYQSLQTGACQFAVLLGNGTFTAEDLRQRFFPHPGMSVYKVKH
jgi:hypothetical protein